MALDPVTAISDLLTSVVNKFPDGNAKELAKTQIEQMRANGNLAELASITDLAKGQENINAVEAASPSRWVAGWRPAIGWVCAVALALVYWPKAILLTTVWAWQCYAIIHIATDPMAIILPAFPDLGVKELMGLLSSMLGIAWMRTYEKKNGVVDKH
jgi:hypothetical protein